MGSKMGFKITKKPKFTTPSTKVEKVYGIKITEGPKGIPKVRVIRTRKVIKNV